MSRFFVGRTALSLPVGLAFVLLPALSRAESQKVKFETVDKVELRGTFYPGKARAPAVILLHKLGGNSQQAGLVALAEQLQGDYSVLAFDFRGHGESTDVDAMFWSRQYPANLSLAGANSNPPRNKISYKDFPKNGSYLPALTNDVAAAKRFLDSQNDAGACNASNVIVIGAEEGAAIGALWIATEWQRRPMVRNNFNGQWVYDPRAKPFGEDIAGAVWLSMPPNMGGGQVVRWVTRSPVPDKVPMIFFYGKNDPKGADRTAQGLLDTMKRSTKNLSKNTGKAEKSTKLAGFDLVQKDLDTAKDIGNYLANVMDSGGRTWVQREPDKGPPLYAVPVNQFLR